MGEHDLNEIIPIRIESSFTSHCCWLWLAGVLQLLVMKMIQQIVMIGYSTIRTIIILQRDIHMWLAIFCWEPAWAVWGNTIIARSTVLLIPRVWKRHNFLSSLVPWLQICGFGFDYWNWFGCFHHFAGWVEDTDGCCRFDACCCMSFENWCCNLTGRNPSARTDSKRRFVFPGEPRWYRSVSCVDRDGVAFRVLGPWPEQNKVDSVRCWCCYRSLVRHLRCLGTQVCFCIL